MVILEQPMNDLSLSGLQSEIILSFNRKFRAYEARRDFGDSLMKEIYMSYRTDLIASTFCFALYRLRVSELILAPHLFFGLRTSAPPTDFLFVDQKQTLAQETTFFLK